LRGILNTTAFQLKPRDGNQSKAVNKPAVMKWKSQGPSAVLPQTYRVLLVAIHQACHTRPHGEKEGFAQVRKQHFDAKDTSNVCGN